MKAPQPIPPHIFIAALQGVVWKPDERRELQKHGVDVIPSNFYSNIPSIAEVEASFEYKTEKPPYLDAKVFDKARIRSTLEALIPYGADFNPDVEGDEATCANGYFWKNSQFSWSDSMSYFAFLRMIKPKHVVEIGSGFSTLVATQALALNGSGSVTCIEPYPRDFLLKQPDVTVKQVKAQDLTPDDLNAMLEDGDVLFIDSTHTVKTGSDCLHIYLRLLPYITKSIYVHVHDIFLPFAMPQDWARDLHIYWTEQYLLFAWLLENPRTQVLFGSAYNGYANPELLEQLQHGRFPPGGGSFWLKYEPAATA